jgi:hypothetical protein
MSDPARRIPDKGAPAVGAFDAFAEKNDAADLTTSFTRAIYTGSGGNIKVTMIDDTVVTLVSVPAGAFLPIQIRRLWSTGTGATDVIGFY